MIYAFICTKPSRRCPGKNDMLLPYTVAWLGYASMWLAERVQIVHVGPQCPAGFPPILRHIPIDEADHHKKLAYAMELAEVGDNDICVLPQLTQPIRRPRLLAVVVDAVRRTGRTTITATVSPAQRWRHLRPDGTWTPPTAEGVDTLLDGVLYAWQGLDGLADVFNPAAPHTVISYPAPYIIDIDHPEDIPPALPSMWAETLLKS